MAVPAVDVLLLVGEEGDGVVGEVLLALAADEAVRVEELAHRAHDLAARDLLAARAAVQVAALLGLEKR